MIEETLRCLSADIVLVESSDSQALASIREQLDSVTNWATDEARGDIAEIASAANSLLGEILCGEVDDPGAALEFVGQAIASLQLAIDHMLSTAERDDMDEGDQEECSILADFLSDQDSALDDMEGLILALGDDAEESSLTPLKGKLHTLKGEAGVLDLMDVSSLCHGLEDVLEQRPLAEASGILLDAIDWMRRRLTCCGAGAAVPAPFEIPAPAQVVEQGSQAHTGGQPSATGAQPDAPQQPVQEIDSAFTEHLQLTADPELIADFVAETIEHLEDVDEQLLKLEKCATDSEAINSVFRAFHSIKGLASFLELPSVQLLSHEAETVLDMARSGQLSIAGAPLAATFEVNDALKRLVQGVGQAQASGRSLAPDSSLPSLMIKLGAIISGGQAPSAGTIPVSPVPEHALSAVSKSAAPASPQPDVGARTEGKVLQVRETIKVDAERLDELVDTIGELVIAEAMVSQSDELNLEDATRLPGLLTRMDKITRELQEMAMSMRMVPIRSTFRRMARLARDVATKVGSKIEFVTQGDDTELDKTVVDSIGDPLVHMVRNAVDHGIEDTTEERVRAGKPPAGRIELRAFHQGGSIHIEIEDDGRGLDAERILAKAIERGLVNEGDKLSQSEIHALIFAPGFSTAAELTDVSGRGVGLDVVKRNIEALRGHVEIRSTPGKGSVFSIRLPLTLAIIDGMLIRVGRERYILPTVSIVRMVTPEEEKITQVFERSTMLQVGDDLVPMFRIDQLFDIPGALQDVTHTSAVIVEQGTQRCAFLVDELLGQQQIVIKPLGDALAGTPGLAGGAIMPDGQVGLILDVAGLVQLAQECDPAEPSRCQPQAVAVET